VQRLYKIRLKRSGWLELLKKVLAFVKSKRIGLDLEEEIKGQRCVDELSDGDGFSQEL